MNIVKSCGTIIFRKTKEDLEFLAIKNKSSKYFGFPKGQMEKGENEETTAKREVLEETGLNINLLQDFKNKIQYKLDDENIKEVTYFIGKPSNYKVKIQEEEISEFKWGNLVEVLNLLSFENDKEVLREAYQFLKF